MTTERSAPKVWKCPVCDSTHSNVWNLETHIRGMAIAYGGPHLEWILARAPDIELSSPRAGGSRLKPFLHPVAGPKQLDIGMADMAVELEPNLSQAYAILTPLEIRLYDFIIGTLREKYGTHEKEWWFSGVPSDIQTSCQGKRKDDSQPIEIERYLTLRDLGKIITREKQWPLFKEHLGEIPGFPGRDQFLGWLDKVSNLRNKVMHPLRREPWGPDDFQTVRRLSQVIEHLTSDA